MNFDWTGHNYLAGRHGRRARATLLNAEDRAGLRRYLLRCLPPEVLNPGSAGRPEAIRATIAQALQDGVLGVSLPSDPGTINRLYAETVGLGPLESLLQDPTVTSITANGPGLLMVERLDRSGISHQPGFESEEAQLQAMDALAQRAGRSLSPAEPVVDLVWDDAGGVSTRVHLNLLGRKAPFLALRRGRKQSFHLGHYVTQERLSAGMAAFLAQAVQAGVSIVVTGMPGSGKTTLLEALLHLTTPQQGHLVLIEDDPEINVHGLTHVSAFQAPRPRPGEEAPIGFLGLVLASLRMNCRTILVCGEVRGPEAGAIIAVMPSYRAVWLTVHGTSPVDGLERLVAAAQMGGSRPPSPFSSGRQEHLVRRNLAAGLQVIVQMDRLADDRIGLAGVYWLEGLDESGQGWDLRPIFQVRQQVVHGELAVSWQANPDFRWPSEIAARLAMAELHAGVLDETAFQAELSTVQAALDGNQPGEAVRRLENLYGLAAAGEQRRITLGLLHRALLALPARWADLLAEAQATAARATALARRRDWRPAEQVLAAAEQDPKLAAALAQLDLDAVREQIAAGLEALSAVERATARAEKLAQRGQPWQALGLLARLPLEKLPPGASGRVVELQAAQLQALRERVAGGQEDGERVAHTILRLLPASYRDLHRWAGQQLNGRRGEPTAGAALNELLPTPATPQPEAADDDERRKQLYAQGCLARAAGDYEQARRLLEQVGDYRAARRLLADVEV